ncbi:MAG: 30S ribosomal protein S6 [Caldiserica bacterium]|nr:30S ribosomal protein S6 [Caldisericota bacterium]
MRLYEGLLIFRPDLEKEEVEKLTQSFEELLQKEGGKVVEKLDWGVRRLAYPIKKLEEGYYTIFNFEASPEAIDKLKTAFKTDERVLRKLITRKK